MKIPLIWLKDYIYTPKTIKQLGNSFTEIGLMLDKPREDEVLDLEHRMDRSDWLSVIGCARDLAAYENLELKLPEVHKEKGLPGGDVKITVDCPDSVRRFNTRVFKNIKVQESPEWLKERLTQYGMPTINNIVDITNFVMVELGQPMHAQDLAKFDKREIHIRYAKEGETITTFDGSVVTLDPSIFVLTQNDKAMVIGGIVGGQHTGVTNETTEIVLDAGNYNQNHIRKASRKLKIQNETVLRYDKFLHPHLTQVALERATKLILELAGGEYYDNYDYYPNPIPTKQTSIRFERIKQVSGVDIPQDQIAKILTALEYKIIESSDTKLVVEIPYFRTDYDVEDDIVADVLRINGYSQIPVQALNIAPPKDITDKILIFEDKLRDTLVNLGMYEYITDPLVKDKSQNLEDDFEQVILENSLNSEKTALRTSIYETLFPITQVYKKRGRPEAGIFEIGKIYKVKKANDLKYENYEEERMIEIICENFAKTYLDISKTTKEVLFGLLNQLGIQNPQLKKTNNDVNIFALANNSKDYLLLGTLKYNSISLIIEKLLQVTATNNRIDLGDSNTESEDISLWHTLDKPFGPIIDAIQNTQGVNKVEVLEEFVKQEGSNQRSVLLRIWGQDIKNVKIEVVRNIQGIDGTKVRQ